MELRVGTGPWRQYIPVDVKTGQVIRHAVYGDDQTGILEVYMTKDDRPIQVKEDGWNYYPTKMINREFKFKKKEEL